jgi:hypothetical protein
MSSKPTFLEPTGLLQLALGLFFGITGLFFLANYDSLGAQFARAFGSNNTLNVIVAIIELAAVIIFIIGLFAPLSSKLMFFSGICILIVWIVIIVMNYFINGFLTPKFLPWLQKLAADLIVLGAIWGVTSTYSD